MLAISFMPWDPELALQLGRRKQTQSLLDPFFYQFVA
jgi:hypothetical protein